MADIDKVVKAVQGAAAAAGALSAVMAAVKWFASDGAKAVKFNPVTGSITKRASKNIAYYPLIVSDSVQTEIALKLARIWELRVADLILLVMKNHPSAEIVTPRQFQDYLRSFGSDDEMIAAFAEGGVDPGPAALLTILGAPASAFRGLTERERGRHYGFESALASAFVDGGGWAVREDAGDINPEFVRDLRDRKAEKAEKAAKPGWGGTDKQAEKEYKKANSASPLVLNVEFQSLGRKADEAKGVVAVKPVKFEAVMGIKCLLRSVPNEDVMEVVKEVSSGGTA